MDKKFRGKIDSSTFIRPFFLFVIISIVFYSLSYWIDISYLIPRYALVFSTLFIGFFLNFWTNYKVTDGGFLNIKIGFKKIKININEIAAIEADNAWKEFFFNINATSLDQLKIIYGKNEVIWISPKDKDGFISALKIKIQ